MKAVQIRAFGPPDVMAMADVPLPDLRAGDVLIRLSAAGVNPKDALVRKGKFRWFTGKRFPMGMGYDFCGVVVKRGRHIRQFNLGDYVFGMVNGWRGKTYAEYVAVKATECTKLPPRLKPREAAGMPLAAQTALQALRDVGQLKEDGRVCINGASGGVGTLAVQIAKTLGAHVTAVCSGKNKALCTSLGADDVLDYTAEDVLAAAHPFDIFFDVFGNYTFGRVRGILSPKGTYISTVPRFVHFWDRFRSGLFLSQQARLVVVKSKWEDLELLAEMADYGQLRPVIDRQFRMEEAADAHAYIETRRATGKVILVPADTGEDAKPSGALGGA
jgi:NADPH:quinone reductase-like Zn-dependent oxidoreductase